MPSQQVLRQKLLEPPLFAEKIWKLSPEPWPISEAQLKEIKTIGAACYSYQQALERLYVRSFTDKKILRNRDIHAKWVATYLDRFKPQGLIDHGRHRMIKGQTPLVLRPDLLITDQGFTMSELDSVPGGIGLTAYLNEVYAEDFPNLIGGVDMPKKFYQTLQRLTPNVKFPLIAIVVSEESATYRPEFEWLGEKLRNDGHDVHVVDPSQIMQMSDESYIPVDGAPRKVDQIYRFFELFDLANVKGADGLFNGIEKADSFIVDPHKWLFAPFDACALIYKNPKLAKKAHLQKAAYLETLDEDDEWNPSDYAIHLTRRARGLPFWFSLAAHGTDEYAKAMERTMAVAKNAADQVRNHPNLKLLMEPTLSIVAFERVGWNIDDYEKWSDKLLADQIGFVTPSSHKGKPILRFAIVNPWTKESDISEILATL
jgi:hypothetical protein